MSTKATLMLLAATLAPLPLYAQQEAPAPAEQAVAPSAASQRAAVLAPLSIVPADAEVAVYLQIPAGIEAMPCSAVALGASKGSCEAVNQGYAILNAMVGEMLLTEGASAWVSATPENVAAVIKDVAQAALSDTTASASATAANFRLHPVFAVLTPAPGREAEMDASVQDCIKGMQQTAEKDESTEFVTIGDFCGLKSTVTSCSGCEESVVMDAVGKGMEGHTFYLLVGKVAGHYVYVVCDAPSEIHFANNAETSILGTEQWAAVDANLADDLVFAASISPELPNAGINNYRNVLTSLKPVAEVFAKLADQDNANANTYKAAAEGVSTLIGQIDAALPTAKEPTFVKVWSTPGACHLEVTSDSLGYLYEPAKLTHAAKGEDPETILYIEGTPLVSSSSIDGEAALQAGAAILCGVYCTLTPELQAGVQQGMEEIATCLPETIGTISSLALIANGCGGSSAIVVDGKATAPAWFTQDHDATISFPRIAIYSGVTDRPSISAGWDGLKDVARTICAECGEDPSMVDMLPIVPTQVGDATSYTVCIPGILTQDVCLNSTISDTAIAIGTSAKLNQELATTTGTQDFAGTVFVFHPGAYFKLEADLTNGNPSQSTMIMGALLESISGSSSIKDGVHTLRIDVKFAPSAN